MTGPRGPAGEPIVDDSKSKKERVHESHVREKLALRNLPFSNYFDGVGVENTPSVFIWLLTSENFGRNFTYHALPDDLQTCGELKSVAVDPTTPNSLYVVTENCLAHSADQGNSWTPCIVAPGLEGPFSDNALTIKNAKIMFLARDGKVPLKTVNGGSTWAPMTSLASLFAHGNIRFEAEVSWTGNTLVVHGNDPGAISRREFGTFVWKSLDDGETWIDETGDLATISPGHGRWFESDFYLITAGEGVTVKRNFEAKGDSSTL